VTSFRLITLLYSIMFPPHRHRLRELPFLLTFSPGPSVKSHVTFPCALSLHFSSFRVPFVLSAGTVERSSFSPSLLHHLGPDTSCFRYEVKGSFESKDEGISLFSLSPFPTVSDLQPTFLAIAELSLNPIGVETCWSLAQTM